MVPRDCIVRLPLYARKLLVENHQSSGKEAGGIHAKKPNKGILVASLRGWPDLSERDEVHHAPTNAVDDWVHDLVYEELHQKRHVVGPNA
jgi:hypothetical protein